MVVREPEGGMSLNYHDRNQFLSRQAKEITGAVETTNSPYEHTYINCVT